MKLITSKLIVILLLIPLLTFPNEPNKGKYKKTRTIKKSFHVNDDALLNINNRYGNVDITSWNENTIEIIVEISVSGNNEDTVLSKFEAIKIEFKSNVNKVSARTLTNKNKSKKWFSWFGWGSSNLSYNINYKIKMPISNQLNVSNDYGSILINELDGKANISCDYGKLIIGSLNHSDNKINFDYTNQSSIEFMNGGQVNADYSGFILENTNNLVLNADYTSSTIENAKNLDYNCDYGSLTVNKASNIKGNGDYLTMNFGEIFKNLYINADYSSIKINAVQDGFESVKIVADYTGIRIGIDRNTSCNVIAKLSFGNLTYNENDFTFTKKRINSTDKYYEGYHKKENTNATISTTTDFGNVKLFEY